MNPDKPKSSYQQEIERRANDLVRVFNPLKDRYIVRWDAKNGVKLFPIEAESEAVFVRYIASKYVKEMYTKIITTEADQAVRDKNEERIKKGLAEMDKTQRTGEQMQFESRFYNPSDEKAREIIATLWVGVETEFGVDQVTAQDGTRDDTKSAFDRQMETMKDKQAKAKQEFKCDYPGCDFTTTTRIALTGHKRSHRKSRKSKK